MLIAAVKETDKRGKLMCINSGGSLSDLEEPKMQKNVSVSTSVFLPYRPKFVGID